MSNIDRLERSDVLGNAEYYAKLRLEVYSKLTRALESSYQVREIYDYVTGIGAINPPRHKSRFQPRVEIGSVSQWLRVEVEELEREIVGGEDGKVYCNVCGEARNSDDTVCGACYRDAPSSACHNCHLSVSVGE